MTADLREALAAAERGSADSGSPSSPLRAASLWACQSCSFAKNPGHVSVCQLCQRKGRSWTCGNCQTRNIVGARACRFCTFAREDDVAPPDGDGGGQEGGAFSEEEGPPLLVLFSLRLNRLAEGTQFVRLHEEWSKYGHVVSGLFDPDANMAYVQYAGAAEAAAAYDAMHNKFPGKDGTTVRGKLLGPTLFRGPIPTFPFRHFRCRQCKGSSPVHSPECVECKAPQPAWIARKLAELGPLCWMPGALVAVRKVTPGIPLKEGELGVIMGVPSVGDTIQLERDQGVHKKEHFVLVESECAEDVPRVRTLAPWMLAAAAPASQPPTAGGGGCPATAIASDGGVHSDDEEGVTEPFRLDDYAEIIENFRLRERKEEAVAAAGGGPGRPSDEEPQPLSRDQTSEEFYELPHYEPVLSIDGLVRWRDAQGSGAAHHAAFMGLPRSLKALCEAGASRWAPNKAGQTAALLEDRLDDVGPSRHSLHRACARGAFFHPPHGTAGAASGAGSEGADRARRLMRMACRTPENYAVPAALGEVRAALVEQADAGQALSLARELLAENPHARGYMAIAMLDEGFGSKAAKLELERYLETLHALDKGDASSALFVDPIFFYAHYMMWVLEGRPPGRKDRLRAAYALTALRCFPVFAADWVDAEDDVDARVRAEGLDMDEDGAAASDEDSDDDDGDVRKPDDPEAEWRLAKESHCMSSPCMDRLMALTGLKSVKSSAMAIVKSVLLSKKRPAGIKAETSMNFLFVGNPGSGKTSGPVFDLIYT